MSETAKKQVVKDRVESIDTGRWMAAVFKLDPDNELHMHLETNDYPRDRFLTAVKMLLQKLDEDQKEAEREAAEPMPLPAFDPLAGLRLVEKNDAEETEVVVDDSPQNDCDGSCREVVEVCPEADVPTGEAAEEAPGDQAAV